MSSSSRSHGTRAKYVVEKCRCAPCRAANNAYAKHQQKRQRLEAASGRHRDSGAFAHPFVDAAPARERLVELGAAGVGYKQVARLAGVSKTSLFGVLHGERDRVRRETATKVLAVRVRHAPHAIVDGARTWRQIESILRVTGWSKARLARELGYERPALQIKRDRVTQRNADRVDVLARRVFLGTAA